MLNFLRTILRVNKRRNLYSFSENISLKNTRSFLEFDTIIEIELVKCLEDLRLTKEPIKVKQKLANKSFLRFSRLDDLTVRLKKDLELDILDMKSEFADSQLSYIFYLGRNILFHNSVEIIKEIYNRERADIGSIYSALLIKYEANSYYYCKV